MSLNSLFSTIFLTCLASLVTRFSNLFIYYQILAQHLISIPCQLYTSACIVEYYIEECQYAAIICYDL